MDKIRNATSSALAVIVTLGLFVLIALGQSVPPELWGAFGVVIGFFFGTSANTAK